jgi:hypothetical protein
MGQFPYFVDLWLQREAFLNAGRAFFSAKAFFAAGSFQALPAPAYCPAPAYI